MDVTDSTFQADVIERSHELPVVVDFWAEWCGPCRMLGPVLESEAAARSGKVELVKVDVDANPAVAGEYGVMSIPAVKAFRNGHVVKEFVGALPPEAVGSFLDELSGPSAAATLLEGEPEAVAEAVRAGHHEHALELLLAELGTADAERRERIRALMVALFAELGQDHPVSLHYRRALASALY
jgi:putative thioredoxin